MWIYSMRVSIQACLFGFSCSGMYRMYVWRGVRAFSWLCCSAFIFHPHIPWCKVTTRRAILAVQVYCSSHCAEEQPTTTNLWQAQLFVFCFLAHTSFRLHGSAHGPPHWLDCPTGCQRISQSHGSNSTCSNTLSWWSKWSTWDFLAQGSCENAWLRIRLWK